MVARVLAAAAEAGTRAPHATYRLQFNRDFTFRQATARAAYLAALGVSDIYASPYLRARPESTHGYDVTDHNALNPGIGSEADFAALVAELRRLGMGQVLDVVPNHMGVGSGNPWWMDVLENGPAAVHAEAFDIDWRPRGDAADGKVLLPVLGDQYGKVLENGELKLVFEVGPSRTASPTVQPSQVGAFYIRYWEHRWPVDPSCYAELLRAGLEPLIARLDAEHPAVLDVQSIITAAANLPGRLETDPDRLAERNREKESIKRRLAALVLSAPVVLAGIQETLSAYTGAPGDPRSFDRLDALIDSQAYRLSYWRVAAEEINYRRFFDINDLAAIRPERPRVFHESHRLLLKLLAHRAVTGVRVDHIDGLWDPALYTWRLQAAYLVARFAGEGTANREPGTDGNGVRPEAGELEDALVGWFAGRRSESGAAARAGSRSPVPGSPPLWLVVEKILGPGEQMPAGWAVAGTTGYDFANAVNGVFVDTANRRALDDIYARFSGLRASFRDVAYECKQLIMAVAMASELNVLGGQLYRLAQRNRRSRDFTRNILTAALREAVASFPVYRTYISSMSETVEPRDRAQIEIALARARRRNPAVDASVFDFLRDTLLLLPVEGESDEDRAARRDFVMKFQQFTGPVAAKGIEDTAFYRYNRLVALNEVGGEPEAFGITVAQFHRHNAERRRRWPLGMTATATHDTKRGEDVRARIDVLSEMPGPWRRAVFRWSRLNEARKPRVEDVAFPDTNAEYLLYQTLIGAWPAEPLTPESRAGFIARVQAYMLKAAKEAKVYTSWINANAPYDDAIQAFVAAILSRGEDDLFVREFLPFQRRVARAGVINSLAQVVLKLAAPGVPDIYQGTELWDLSLVDPDNRRPVDYDRRAAILDELGRIAEESRAETAGALLDGWPDGHVKLYVTQRALTLRRERPAVFLEGDYVPLEAAGARADHICAFARTHDDAAVIAVVPRFSTRLVREPDWLPLGQTVWGDTLLRLPETVPAGRYRDRFTGDTVATLNDAAGAALPLAAVFARFPVALLVREVGDEGGPRAGEA